MKRSQHERYLEQARRILRLKTSGNEAEALDALYQLAHDTGYGDPLVAFLITSRKLVSNGFKDATSLLNYLKLSGYGGVDLSSLKFGAFKWVENSPSLDAIRLVNPAVAIAAIELIRSGDILTYARMLGRGYSLALTLARLIVFGVFDFQTPHTESPRELLLDDDELILMALLGENYPIARSVLGGKKVRIPGKELPPVRAGMKSDLVAAAVERIVDRYLERLTLPEGSPGELLEALDVLLHVAKRRSRLIQEDISRVDDGET